MARQSAFGLYVLSATIKPSLDEWEELRNTADKIKSHTLSHLDEYLEVFEKNAQARGIHVHWAKDAKSTMRSF